MATVYLHIGLPKTGSTTIQNLMWDNRDVFEKFGICYPQFDYKYEMVSFRRNGHFLFAPYINEDGSRDSSRPAAEYEEGLNALEELGKKYDKLLLTDEGLWWGSHSRKNFWEQLKKDMNSRALEVRIIVYLRRQDSWIESHWAQNIKDGRTSLTMHDYLAFMKKKGYPLDYHAYISSLVKIFGKDSLYVRILEQGQFKGEEHTLQSDFLDIFGLSLSDGFTVKKNVYNTKFEGNFLEIKRLMNLVPELRTRQHIVFQGISKMDSKNPAKRDYSGYSFFAPEDRMAFQQQFEESNRRLAVEFFGRKDGILFYEPPKNLPELKINEQDLLRDSILLYGKIFDLIQQEDQAVREQMLGKEAEPEMPIQETAVRRIIWQAIESITDEYERRFQQALRDERQKYSSEIKELKKELKSEHETVEKLSGELKELKENSLSYRLKQKLRHK